MKWKKLHEHRITKGTSPDNGPSIKQSIHQKPAIVNIQYHF